MMGTCMFRLSLSCLLLEAALPAQRPPEPPREVLLEGRFHSPLSYTQALERLDAYYREQINRPLNDVLPAIGERQHFDVWHDIWVVFSAGPEGLEVGLRRASDPMTLRMAKSWMLELSGRMGSETPLRFSETALPEQVSGEFYLGLRDIERALQGARPGLVAVASWRHAGLFASAEPPALVVLEKQGLAGASRLRVVAEKEGEARELIARMAQYAALPRICAVVNETAVLEEDLKRDAAGVERDALMRAPGVVIAGSSTKTFEDRLRAGPDAQKRLSAARHAYQVRFRVDQPYRQAVVGWTWLKNYSRKDGSFESEVPVTQASLANPKKAEGGLPAAVRCQVENLQPGAYRIRLEGEKPDGGKVPIDQRIYWFDGRVFQEL